MTLRVSSLWRFPVKSLAGSPHNSLQLDTFGPQWDRRWMVVNEAGGFVTQRQLPSMCRIAAQWRDDHLTLFSLDGDGEGVSLALPNASTPHRRVRVWQDDCDAIDMGERAAQWLSDQLGRKLRLCYMPDSVVRQIDLAYSRPGDQVSFADGFPILLCNQASVDVLSEGLGWQLEVQRFRPNIVVDGAMPFAEEAWRKIRVGGLEMEVVKPCSRCVIPSINPATAERQPAVFNLLRQRCSRDGQVYFGQNLIHRDIGTIAVGEAVEILSSE